MSQPTQAAPSDATRYLPLLLVLFAGSGCAALIYEIVWYQMLQLAIGSTSVSMGVLLATFMGGLCIGSLGLPRMKLAGQHPLKVYAKLEAGIAVCGLFVVFADSVCRQGLRRGRRIRPAQHAAARFPGRDDLAATGDHPDGSVSSGLASRWIQSPRQRRIVVGFVIRR